MLTRWAEAGLDRRSAVFGFDVEVDRAEILEVTGVLVDEDLERCLPGCDVASAFLRRSA